MKHEVERRAANGANHTAVEQSLFANVKREIGNNYVYVEYVPDVDAAGQAQQFGVVIASVDSEEIASRYMECKNAALAANAARLKR